MKTATSLLTALLLGACGVGEGMEPDVLDSADQALSSRGCVDITHGDGIFDGSTVRMVIGLGSEPCRQVTYSVQVLGIDANGAYTVPLGEQQMRGDTLVGIGDDPGLLGFTIVTGPAPKVCIFASVTSAKGHLFDRAPDADGSCVVLAPNVVGEYRFD